MVWMATTKKKRFVAVALILSILVIVSCFVSVFIITLIIPPFDGLHYCNDKGCYNLEMKIDGGEVLPNIRYDPFFIIFIMGFASSAILLLLIIECIDRWLPLKRIVVYRE